MAMSRMTRAAGDAARRRTAEGSRRGWSAGTSSGTDGFGRPDTRTRIPGGGRLGSSAAMLRRPGPASASSSRPSTTSIRVR
ncbi:hypothetical protein DRB96_39480 [Streptomyces sp. ICC1]|nr:hypothetical protein DRB96_39480 [Streptomyces sp. ICC1]